MAGLIRRERTRGSAEPARALDVVPSVNDSTKLADSLKCETTATAGLAGASGCLEHEGPLHGDGGGTVAALCSTRRSPRSSPKSIGPRSPTNVTGRAHSARADCTASAQTTTASQRTAKRFTIGRRFMLISARHGEGKCTHAHPAVRTLRCQASTRGDSTILGRMPQDTEQAAIASPRSTSPLNSSAAIAKG